jgi:hypothetical protein
LDDEPVVSLLLPAGIQREISDLNLKSRYKT